MPLPVTPHRLELTPAQLTRARKVAASRSAPNREVLRARLTLVVAEQPGIRHAGKRCGLERHTVYSWRRRWAEECWSLQDAPRSGRPPVFPPQETTLAKALACARPTDHGCPLSRLSGFDVYQEAWKQGCTMSYSTVWRRLDEDALRPWFHRPWLFPRDPALLAKATPVLELVPKTWSFPPTS